MFFKSYPICNHFCPVLFTTILLVTRSEQLHTAMPTLSNAVRFAYKQCPTCAGTDDPYWATIHASEIKTEAQVKESLTYRLKAHLITKGVHTLDHTAAAKLAQETPVTYSMGRPSWGEIPTGEAWHGTAKLPTPPPAPVRTRVVGRVRSRSRSHKSPPSTATDQRAKQPSPVRCERSPTPETEIVEGIILDIPRVNCQHSLVHILSALSKQIAKKHA